MKKFKIYIIRCIFILIEFSYAQSYVEHFDNLNNWANTTNFGQAWIIDSEGYIGNCAKSEVAGSGYGDQLTYNHNFSSDASLSIWIKKSGYDPITIYFKIDDEMQWEWGGNSTNGSEWTKKEINISPGNHEIKIETDYGGTSWIDEMEIYEIADLDSLILDGQTLNLSGYYEFDYVSLSNGSQINVFDSLEINSPSINILNNSDISGGSLLTINTDDFSLFNNSKIQGVSEINLTVSDSLTVDETSSINADGTGNNSQGIGTYASDYHDGGGGGGYGGQGGVGGGGVSGGNIYGNFSNIEDGSRGGHNTQGQQGGYGGGKIVINSPFTQIDGSISSNGANGNGSTSSWGGSGGGSGGGISIVSPFFEISGTIEVKGGQGGNGSSSSDGGGGGGGRIYIQTDSPHDFWNNLIISGGDTPNSAYISGENGRYFVETMAGQQQSDDLILNNHTFYTSGSFNYDDVILTNSIIYVYDSLIINVANSLIIDETSSINADGTGNNSQGIGTYASDYHDGGGGGGYGGQGGVGGGGVSGGNIYGNFSNIEDGSRGGHNTQGQQGGYGGGKIVINSPFTQIDGSISSNGANGNGSTSSWGGSGGGSGGGISIVSPFFEISGTIEVKGGQGGNGSSSSDGGGGGGGRIYIQTDSPHDFWNNIIVNGGAGYNNGEAGRYLVEDFGYPGRPSAPKNLTASSGNQQVSLTWDQNSELDFAKYRIYRDTSSPATTLIDSVVGNIADTSYTDTGLTNGQIYYYRVSAVDSAGNGSAFSTEVNATPVSKEILLSDNSYNFGNVQIDSSASWSFYIKNIGTDSLTVSNITKSISEYSLSQTSCGIDTSDSVSIEILFSPSSIKTFLDTVRIFSNDSDDADTLKLIYLSGTGVDTLAPDIPQNLVAYSGNREIFLRWHQNTESDFAKYRIYRDTSSPATTLIDSVVGNIADTSYTDTGLTNDTTYYYRITAVDDSGIESGYSNEINVTPHEYGTITDIDGNTYQTVEIGNQTWMAENLNVTHYRNGDDIPKVTDAGTWSGLSSGAYSNYDNDDSNANTYGSLYNWYAVDDSRIIAPDGWHVPTDEEWTTLETYLTTNGYSGIEGTVLKSTTGWNSGGDGTDNYGLTVLPAGYRSNGGNFELMGDIGIFWSASESGNNAISRILNYNNSIIYHNNNDKRNGFSVRCVKDIISAPQNLTATPGNQQITLRWDQNTESDLHKYNIYRDKMLPVTTLIDSVVGTPPDTFYIDDGLTNGQTYYYRITAVDDAGNESEFSNEVYAIPYRGSIWFVSNSGNDFTGNGSINNPYEHIQWAVDISLSGDTIMVLSGTYIENITIDSKILTIIGNSIETTVLSPQSVSQQTLYCSNADTLILKNISIIGNNDGAGIWIYNSPYISIKNMVIKSFMDYGAQFSNTDGNSVLHMKNVLIEDNVNGLNIFSTEANLSNMTVTSNHCGIRFSTGNNNQLNMRKVIVSHNVSEEVGTGLYIDQVGDGITITIDSCRFEANVCNNNVGSAIFSSNSYFDSLLVVNTVFKDNYSKLGGSAIYIDGVNSIVKVDKCIFNRNNGHLVYGTTIRSSSDFNIWNSIFINSESSVFGGANCYNMENAFKIINSIIWNNKVVDYSWPQDSIKIIYSCIEENWAGIGNISDNPQFCDPYNNEFTLSSTSPCIGAGWSNQNIGGVKVGCSQSNSLIYVSNEGNDENGSGTYDNPFLTVAHSMEVLFPFDTLIILPGTYVENIQINQNNRVIGSLFLINNDTSVIRSTIIDGSNSDGVFTVTSTDCQFSGMTIQNGYRIGSGAGIQITHDNHQINNCIFVDNLCEGTLGFGGAIALIESNTNIIECTFFNNMGREGGAVSIKRSNPKFNSCTFNSNKSLSGGDAIFHVYSSGEYTSYFHDCKFLNSEINAIEIEQSDGGSMYFDRCVFINNKSSISVRTFNFDISVNNCTFYSSLIPDNLSVNQSSDAIISNSIFWDSNTISDHVQGFSLNSSYSLTSDVGQNNIISDPMFLDVFNNNYHLRWGSPAIDAGDPNSPLDPDGTRADMGAYYFDQRDSIPPSISILSPIPAGKYGTKDTIDVDWEASDNLSLLWNKIYFSYGNGYPFELVDSLSASTHSYGLHVPDSVVSSSCKVIVRVGDLRQNTSSDTSETFTIYDNTNPSVHAVQPTTGFSIPEYNRLTVQWTATDNIAMDSVLIIYTNEPGVDLQFMGKVPADSSQLTFNIPAGITDQAMIYLHGWDTSGNDTLVHSPNFSVTDNTPPDSVFIDSVANCYMNDMYQIKWRSVDNSGSFRSHHIFTSSDNSAFTLIDSVGGSEFIYNWLVPNVLSDDYRIKITSFDNVGLSRSDTSNVFSILDGIPPEITVLTPDNDFAIPEYMPLTVTWTATDNIAMDSVLIIYTNEPGVDLQFMGKVPADSSQFTFNIPAGITDQAMIYLHGWDTSGNDTLVHSSYFTVTDNTPPEVALLTELQGSEFAIGSMIEIEWIATDNVEVTTIDLLYSTDLSSGWKVISIGEENDGKYQWLIPNDPSDQCRLKVVAHDAIGIAEAINGDPFSIVIEYPCLVSAPSIISQRDSIWLQFNQALDTDKFPDGLSIISSVIENPEVQLMFDNNNRSVALYCENTFVSADTLLIVLTADQVTNVFGYGLDGNHSSTFEGAPADNDTVEVIVRYSADFDANDQVNWDDLVILSDAWYGRDYRYELGPVLGDPPHFQITPDSLFNIEDAMTFARMWNWQSALGKRTITMPQMIVGSDIVTEQIGNTVVVHSLPVMGKRVVVQYDSKQMTVRRKEAKLSKPSEMTFKLYAECPDSGRVEFISYSFDQNPVNDPVSFTINSKERYPIDVKIGFEGINAGGELVQSSVSIVQFQPVPDKYELYPNYPNPFNSSTVIEYAIPEKSNVSIEIYDLRGYKVRSLVDSPHEAHYYRRLWDAKDDNGRLVASGLYFMRIVAVGETRTFTKTKKMMMIR